jgi:hypothetical protein
MLQVSSREVPITPSGSITWEFTDTMNGALYLPVQGPEISAKTAALLQSGAVGGSLIAEGKSGGRVYESPAHDLPGIVIKEFTPRIVCNEDRADNGDLSDLRANVMLAAGLNMLEQRKGPWQIRGAQVLGALILQRDPSDKSSPHARWIIEKADKYPDYHEACWFTPVRSEESYVDGQGIFHAKYDRVHKPEWKPSLPSPKKRIELYEEAVALANGTKPKDMVIHFDDHPRNMVLTHLPVMNGRNVVTQGRVVKLDVRPLKGFDY